MSIVDALLLHPVGVPSRSECPRHGSLPQSKTLSELTEKVPAVFVVPSRASNLSEPVPSGGCPIHRAFVAPSAAPARLVAGALTGRYENLGGSVGDAGVSPHAPTRILPPVYPVELRE